MGWNEYLLRKGRAVYLPDQVSRRAPDSMRRCKRDPIRQRPALKCRRSGPLATKLAWTLFRFGPRWAPPFAISISVESFEEFGKQVIPDLNAGAGRRTIRRGRIVGSRSSCGALY